MRSNISRSAYVRGGIAFLVMAGLAIVPIFFGPDWLQVATMVVVLAVGVVGWNLLYSAGQLSLGHAFFMGVGGFTYAFLAGQGDATTAGLGLAPVVALPIAVAIAGIAGLLFSPISSRLGGLSLAAASLGLVFLGDHFLLNATYITGGFSGRGVEPFAVGGVKVVDAQSLWFFVVIVASASFWFASRLARSRVGLGLNAIRDGELFASAMGVRVRLYKAQAFLVSSMYAGLSGALLAMVVGVLVPETFGFTLSLNILMIAILGGTGYVVLGAIIGSLIFVSLPELLNRYSDLLPLVSTNPIGPGISPADAASYVYGAAIVIMIIAEPEGVVALGRRLGQRFSKKSTLANTGRSGYTN